MRDRLRLHDARIRLPSLADGGFDPNVDLKHVSGTAVTTIPLPAVVWLLASGLLVLTGISRKLKNT